MQEKENQTSGECSTKKSMLEKLTEEYHHNLKLGNGGHAAGYYSEIAEKIKSEYPFPRGTFTLKQMEERFFLWHYDPMATQD